MFITAQAMKHEAYPLEPGKKGKLGELPHLEPDGDEPAEDRRSSPATSQSSGLALAQAHGPEAVQQRAATTRAKIAAPIPVGAVTWWGRHRSSLLVDRR